MKPDWTSPNGDVVLYNGNRFPFWSRSQMELT